MKDITVFAFVDPMGCGLMTQEEEYVYIEKEFNRLFTGHNVTFKHDIQPHMLENNRCDVYVFDFGGLTFGCDGLIRSFLNKLKDDLTDYPDTCFVLYSSQTVDWFVDLMEDAIELDITEGRVFPNLVCYKHVDLDDPDWKNWILNFVMRGHQQAFGDVTLETIRQDEVAAAGPLKEPEGVY